MSTLSIRLIKSAFVYLAAGIALGVTFAFDRVLGASLRPVHAEINLWGWVTLLIYGMGYHMLPRFTGRPLRSERLAAAQAAIAIGGAALAATGWLALLAELPLARLLLVSGGALELIAGLIFTVLMARLLRPARR